MHAQPCWLYHLWFVLPYQLVTILDTTRQTPLLTNNWEQLWSTM